MSLYLCFSTHLIGFFTRKQQEFYNLSHSSGAARLQLPLNAASNTRLVEHFPPYVLLWFTEPPPSPSSTSCPPAFVGIFPSHVWPCVLHHSLCPPPSCTACSQTLPARRSEIELNSSLTPGRAPKQETRGISGEGQEGRGREGSRPRLYLDRGLPVFWQRIKVPVFTQGTSDHASKETF